MSVGPSREKIVDLEGTIQGLVHWNRVISTDLARPQRVQAEIDRDLAIIKACQERIARAHQNLLNGHEQIAKNDIRILELREEIVMEQNKLKVAKLLELVSAINDFEPEAIAACDSDEPADSSDDEDYDPTDEEVLNG